MMNWSPESPGVFVALIAIRGSTSLKVLYVDDTGPAGGLSGPACESTAATPSTVRHTHTVTKAIDLFMFALQELAPAYHPRTRTQSEKQGGPILLVQLGAVTPETPSPKSTPSSSRRGIATHPRPPARIP